MFNFISRLQDDSDLPVNCSSEVKLPSSEFSEVESLTRQSGFSRSPAFLLQKPPPPTSPWVLSASVPHAPPPPAWGLAPRPTVRCPQQLAFRLSHTLKTPVARLALGQARGPCRRPAARLSPSCARGGSATRPRAGALTWPSQRAARSRSGSGPHWRTPHPGCSGSSSPALRPTNPLRDSPPPRRWERGGE